MTLTEKIKYEIDQLQAQKSDLQSRVDFLQNRIQGLKKLADRADLLPADEQNTILELLG